ncbi:MAG: chorismate-binding protein [Ramlibacter sp.]|nr:chorismate-binding protein [Ramlibacter sp.]
MSLLRLQARARPADAGEVEAALARLDQGPGMYFGVDAGIAGLHPLQATLVEAPALLLRVRAAALQVEPASALGQDLLAQPALADWARATASHPPVAALRALLQAFEPRPEVMLLGALRFNAHRLATPGTAPDEDIGVLFLPEAFWQRDAQGQWTHVTLSLPAAAGSVAAPLPASATGKAPPAEPSEPRDDHAPGGYAAMVARALVHLRERPLVSLTLSQSYRRRTHASAAQAFARLRHANPAPMSFLLNDGLGGQLFGASPDLQLVVQDGTVQSLPVCGTVARAPGPVGEAEAFRELVNEAVDAASLAICTDALRNDLAPLCEPGSLRLTERRRQMALATIVHAVDRLQGRLRPGVDAWDALVATAAPVMLTGTPRPHALAAIAELEASPRGWYGGLGVLVRADGHALVGTLLRAAALRDGVAEVRTGGDLVADSVPAREEQESRHKALSLWRALGLDAPPGAGAPDAPPRLPAVVNLHDSGDDPFPAAVRELLLGLGLGFSPTARPTVLLGHPPPAFDADHTVALGDAAFGLLARAGFEVTPITPEHGRLLPCRATDEAPWANRTAFIAAGYASWALRGGAALPQGWSVWLRDTHDSPRLLVHAQRRVACLLLRPESLLSDPRAVQALGHALAFCTPAANTP